MSGNCVRCGIYRPHCLHRDHIIPKYAGGADDESNIQLLCGNCHEDKTLEDFKKWPLPQMSAEDREKTTEAVRAAMARRDYNDPEWRESNRQHLAKVRDPQDPERRKKISDTLKQYFARPDVVHPRKGVRISNEQKDKIRATIQRKKNK